MTFQTCDDGVLSIMRSGGGEGGRKGGMRKDRDKVGKKQMVISVEVPYKLLPNYIQFQFTNDMCSV
jgi:hypothetical protein